LALLFCLLSLGAFASSAPGSLPEKTASEGGTSDFLRAGALQRLRSHDLKDLDQESLAEVVEFAVVQVIQDASDKGIPVCVGQDSLFQLVLQEITSGVQANTSLGESVVGLESIEKLKLSAASYVERIPFEVFEDVTIEDLVSKIAQDVLFEYFMKSAPSSHAEFESFAHQFREELSKFITAELEGLAEKHGTQVRHLNPDELDWRVLKGLVLKFAKQVQPSRFSAEGVFDLAIEVTGMAIGTKMEEDMKTGFRPLNFAYESLVDFAVEKLGELKFLMDCRTRGNNS